MRNKITANKKAYVIISDIHGNINALTKVIKTIKEKNIEVKKWFCLGDIVGYYPDPDKCIEKIQKLKATCITGNHDQAVIGKLDITWFNAMAKQAIIWSRNNLMEKHKNFLRELPLIEKNSIGKKSLIFAHGTPDPDHPFDYLLTPGDFRKVESTLKKHHIVFVGHTHIPFCFYYQKNKWKSQPSLNTINTNKNENYIINVGSVGQPRDGNPEASYVLYYPEQEIISMERIAYNIDEVKKKIKENNLPTSFARRLEVGR